MEIEIEMGADWLLYCKELRYRYRYSNSNSNSNRYSINYEHRYRCKDYRHCATEHYTSVRCGAIAIGQQLLHTG